MREERKERGWEREEGGGEGRRGERGGRRRKGGRRERREGKDRERREGKGWRREKEGGGGGVEYTAYRQECDVTVSVCTTSMKVMGDECRFSSVSSSLSSPLPS